MVPILFSPLGVLMETTVGRSNCASFPPDPTSPSVIERNIHRKIVTILSVSRVGL